MSIKPYRSIFSEFTIRQWAQIASPLTMKYRAERNKEKGMESKLAQFVDLDYKEGSPIAQFLTEPTFEFNVDTVRPGSKGKFTKDNAYQMEVQFVDLEQDMIDLFQGKGERHPSKAGWENVTLEMFKGLLKSTDVRWLCTCPSSYWMNHSYQLTQVDSAIYPQNNAGKGIWQKRLGPKSGLCKHLVGLSKAGILKNAPKIFRMVKSKAGKVEPVEGVDWSAKAVKQLWKDSKVDRSDQDTVLKMAKKFLKELPDLREYLEGVMADSEGITDPDLHSVAIKLIDYL